MKVKNKPPPDDPAQSARFVETAKATSADGRDFARVFKKIIPSVPAKKRRYRG